MDAGVAMISAAVIAAVPTSIAVLRNASQHSVDRLHECLEEHTAQDALNFDALRAENREIRRLVADQGTN